MATESLGAIAEIIMGQSPAGEMCNASGNGLPLLNGPTEFGSHHPTPVQYTTDTRKRAIPGDILFCVRGSTTGRMNWADREYAIGRGIAAIRHKRGQRFQHFIRALIDYQLPDLLAQATGSTFPNVSSGQIASLRCDVLDEGEQLAIASVLGALDDKTELNRQMNETLEALAQGLFKFWFVDATAEGLPKGWRESRLGDLADVTWGDTNTTKASYTTQGFPAYSASGRDGFLPHHDFDRIGVVVSAIGANAGVTWLALGKWSCIKNTIRFWATEDEVSTEYLFYATLGKEKWPLRGSAQPFIAQGDARAMKIIVPSDQLGKRFGEVVGPLHSKISANNEESRTLAALRDALLPKLLSREIRVDSSTSSS